jgi:3-deoxy-D-manno-octulosonic-acid transferase
VRALLDLAYSAAGILASSLVRVAPESQHKLIRSFRARRGGVARVEDWAARSRDLARPLLWMHAPSVGEGLQARPVLQLLRARRPDIQLAYTFFSPSAEAFARSLDVDVTEYLPFDTTPNAVRMLEALRPSALVFAKLDLWPRLCLSARRSGVRTGLISGTLAEGSGRLRGVGRALLGDAYAALDAAGAISSEDAGRLVALGAPATATTVLGDTRYDQVWTRATEAPAAGAIVERLRDPRPTLVAGSTWPADGAVLLPAWLAIRARTGARLIIAPHEPTPQHLEPIERWAAANRISLVRLSSGGPADAEVVLVDTTGVLGDLYALGTVAFVGGGFHRAGLHSVIEPAAFGVPVSFGPQRHNSRDASLLIDARGGTEVRDTASAAALLGGWLDAPEEARTAGARARGVVERGLGAAERAYELVVGLL